MITTPKTDAELADALHALVNTIRSYNDPSDWPLSDEQRIWFVRRVMGDVKTIAESEPFLRAEVVRAARDVNQVPF